MHSCGCHYFILMPRPAGRRRMRFLLSAWTHRVFVWFHTEFSAAARAPQTRKPLVRVHATSVCIFFVPFITARRTRGNQKRISGQPSRRRAPLECSRPAEMLKYYKHSRWSAKLVRCLHAILWSAGTWKSSHAKYIYKAREIIIAAMQVEKFSLSDFSARPRRFLFGRVKNTTRRILQNASSR